MTLLIDENRVLIMRIRKKKNSISLNTFCNTTQMSMYYSQQNLVIPELDNDPAILKIIVDGEKLERETYRKELMQILKIQPTSTSSDLNHSVVVSHITTNSTSQESVPVTPGSTADADRTSQTWAKRTVPTTPNSSSHRRQHYRSTFNQRSLNSSGNSSTNRSLADSPKSSNYSFMKQTRSDTNLSSPASFNKTNSVHMKSNVSLTSSGIIVTDYRQSTMMKRIVNPQWNIIPFA